MSGNANTSRRRRSEPSRDRQCRTLGSRAAAERATEDAPYLSRDGEGIRTTERARRSCCTFAEVEGHAAERVTEVALHLGRDVRGCITLSPEREFAQRSTRRRSCWTLAEAEDCAAERARRSRYTAAGKDGRTKTKGGARNRETRKTEKKVRPQCNRDRNEEDKHARAQAWKIRMHVCTIEAEADTRSCGCLTRRSKLSRDEGRDERRSPEGSTRSYNKGHDGKSHATKVALNAEVQMEAPEVTTKVAMESHNSCD
ncbi:hypothetical protein H6P81_016114 [Aristolochia fimbriata]|uniref:Uncharacterized protein n=1 Tax=Aristolochia fimbriata TaxID=158543 RepID=A0AAV7E952_ARIFI|nr:hypothetical protein H6P81_016114 [Aristolochia fimbriata]